MRLRWYVKKVARFVVVYGNFVANKIFGIPNLDALRILTYHRFGPDPRDPFCVSMEDFDAQMKLLSAEQRAISLSQLELYLAGEANLPEYACLVTIDDGMLSTLEVALPILQRYGIPAVAFVSSNLIGLDGQGLPERYLTGKELLSLSRNPLVEIGSHAHNHVSMGQLPLPEMAEEARKSKSILEAVTKRPVNTFAYPFGMQNDHNRDTDNALASAGYKITFNSMHGAILTRDDCQSLPRVKVEGGDSLSMFRHISRGAMDIWRVVDDRLFRAQRVRQEITG